MKFTIKIIFLLLSLSLVSCEKLVMNPKPGTDNPSIFNEYSKICIEKFGMTAAKNINLIELADSLRPLITEDLSEQELFDLMGLFVDRMQEGHTQINSIDNKLSKGYYWFIGYPLGMNRGLVLQNYYGPEANPDVQIIAPSDSYYEIYYGYLPQDKNIGYISILSFEMNITDAELDQMMAYLKNAKGIIIDVRSNLGGYIEFASRLASYFTSKEIIVGTNYIKNGPGENDFATSIMKIKPNQSPYTFTKPIAILHDRVTFSSGSLFCLMTRAMENTTTLGITFGGGTGEIMDGFLANSWHYTISTSNFVDPNGNPTDQGLDPDIYVPINLNDTITDAMIERAILELQ